MSENEIAKLILDCAFRVHRKLGPGLLESVYCEALAVELRRINLTFHREVPIKIPYDDEILGVGFRGDFVVEERVLIEVKSVEQIIIRHRKQTLNFLKLSKLRLGLLLNFNAPLLKMGISRFVNGLIE
jgi:GxxExxY protein